MQWVLLCMLQLCAELIDAMEDGPMKEHMISGVKARFLDGDEDPRKGLEMIAYLKEYIKTYQDHVGAAGIQP